MRGERGAEGAPRRETRDWCGLEQEAGGLRHPRRLAIVRPRLLALLRSSPGNGEDHTFLTQGDALYYCISVADRKAGTMLRMLVLVSLAVAAEVFVAAARPTRVRLDSEGMHASIHGCDAC